MKEWIRFAKELDLEGEPEMDFYDSVYVELSLIKQRQSPEAAAALFNYGAYFIFNSFELRGAAGLLAKGWPLEQIGDYIAANGSAPTPLEYEESRAALRAFRADEQGQSSMRIM